MSKLHDHLNLRHSRLSKADKTGLPFPLNHCSLCPKEFATVPRKEKQLEHLRKKHKPFEIGKAGINMQQHYLYHGRLRRLAKWWDGMRAAGYPFHTPWVRDWNRKNQAKKHKAEMRYMEELEDRKIKKRDLKRMMKLPLNENVEPEVDLSRRTISILVGKSAGDPKPETVELSKETLWNQRNQLMLVHLTTMRMVETVLQRTMW